MGALDGTAVGAFDTAFDVPGWVGGGAVSGSNRPSGSIARGVATPEARGGLAAFEAAEWVACCEAAGGVT